MPFCNRKPGAQLARRYQEVILAQLNVLASLEKGFSLLLLEAIYGPGFVNLAEDGGKGNGDKRCLESMVGGCRELGVWGMVSYGKDETSFESDSCALNTEEG